MDPTSLLPVIQKYEEQVLASFTGAPWLQLAEEKEILTRFYHLLSTQSEVLARNAWVGHLTASALLVDEKGERVALTHHSKLGMWLQFGGHIDPEDPSLLEAAKRETREESGCSDCEPFSGPDAQLPLDIDIHALPAIGTEPAHFHFDVRFLLHTKEATLSVSSESKDVKWFSFEEAFALAPETSLQRLFHKAIWKIQNMNTAAAAPFLPGLYRHYKKETLYRVLERVSHSETLEPLVLYEALYDNPVSKFWVRPEAMFFGKIEVDGQQVDRFTRISD